MPPHMIGCSQPTISVNFVLNGMMIIGCISVTIAGLLSADFKRRKISCVENMRDERSNVAVERLQFQKSLVRRWFSSILLVIIYR